MDKYQKIAAKIISTYETNLFAFREKYQYHWAARLYRITKSDRYLHPIYMDFQKRTLRWARKISHWKVLLPAGKIGRKMLDSFDPTTPKDKEKYELYKKRPEVLFFLKLNHYLFLTKVYGLDKLDGFNKYYLKAIRKLKNQNFEKILLDEKLIRANPSIVANNASYLSYLGITKLERQLAEVYKRIWLDFSPQSKSDWQNKVYALTHLIIPATHFYQRFVTRGQFNWILKYFEKNFDEIVENTNADVIAEVGLCFKLCQHQESEVFEKARGIIAENFDAKRGYIPREDNPEGLEKAEHRNAIATLLLSDYQKFFPGPDLYEYMINGKRELFVPKKVEWFGIPEEDMV